MRPWLERARAPPRSSSAACGFSVAAAAVVATGAITGGGLASTAARLAGRPGGNRWRRPPGSGLPGNGAGRSIQPLFQHGDAGKQPVAIAVQRFDRGCQPLRLAVAVPGDRLNLLRLARQIGRRDLVAPPSDRRLIGEHRQNHRADRGNAPRSEPPQRAAVEFVLLRQKAGQQAAGILGFETATLDGVQSFFWPYEVVGPPEACPNHTTNINRN